MTTKYEQVTVAVAGANGSATGSGKTRPITGLLLAVHVDYTTQPATADVTIATAGSTAPALTLLTLADKNADGWFFPRQAIHNTAGAAQTQNEIAPVADAVTVSVADGNAGAVAVTLVYEG